MPGLTPDQVQQIHKFLHDKQLMQAVKIYHDATGVSLAEARDAVQEMARNEYSKPPSGVRVYDNPVLESKIKSLLTKGKKLEAVKIYRAEYGSSLNEAKAAVEQIEAIMPANPGVSASYEPAIGKDPFVEEEEARRRRMIVLGVALIVALCGVGGFFLRLLSTP
jgi:ribosomal protein L7/L12